MKKLPTWATGVRKKDQSGDSWGDESRGELSREVSRTEGAAARKKSVADDFKWALEQVGLNPKP